MVSLPPRFRLPVGTYCFLKTETDGFVRVRVCGHVSGPESDGASDTTYYRVACTARVRGAWTRGREAVAPLSALIPPKALRNLRSGAICRAHDWRDQFQLPGSYGTFRGVPLCLDATGRVCAARRVGSQPEEKHILVRGLGADPSGARYLFIWHGDELRPLWPARPGSTPLTMTEAEATYFCVPLDPAA